MKNNIEKLEEKRIDVINDIISCNTVMEEIWKYHPDNPKQVSPVDEYNHLVKIKGDLENEVSQIEDELNNLKNNNVNS